MLSLSSYSWCITVICCTKPDICTWSNVKFVCVSSEHARNMFTYKTFVNMYTVISPPTALEHAIHVQWSKFRVAVHYSLSTGKHHSSGAALSLVPTALVPILARLVIFPCIHTQWIIRICILTLCMEQRFIPLSPTLGLSLSTSSPSSVNIQMSHDKEGHHNHYLHNGPFIITHTSFSEH